MSFEIISQNLLKAIFYSCFMSLSLFAQITPNSNEYTSKNGYNNCDFFTNGENHCLSKYLNKNSSVVFDVGANVGEWTSIALTYAPSAKFYAFEVHPKIFRLLANKMNNKNVKCLPFGLSNEKGRKTLWVWGDDTNIEKSGLNSLFCRPILEKIFDENPDQIEVSVAILDDFCKRNHIEHIDYLKIDTEGNEYFVLLGANKMISNHCIDIIQFEYGGCYIDSQTSLELVYNFLKERNYDIFRILPKTLLPISNWELELENFQYSNYLAILNKKKF